MLAVVHLVLGQKDRHQHANRPLLKVVRPMSANNFNSQPVNHVSTRRTVEEDFFFCGDSRSSELRGSWGLSMPAAVR